MSEVYEALKWADEITGMDAIQKALQDWPYKTDTHVKVLASEVRRLREALRVSEELLAQHRAMWSDRSFVSGTEGER